MKICGFHSWHDCAFCVLEDGRPLIHAELERYTREKEPKGDGLDFFYESYPESEDVKHFVHVLDVSEGGIKQRHRESFDKMEKQLKKNEGRFYVVGHHMAHAAHAFYSSNMDDALIITIDGGGPELNAEGYPMTTTLGYFSGEGKLIQRVAVAPYSNIDIGGFWTHCTKEIFGLSGGYPKGHQAGTVMAMACMGDRSKWSDYFLKSGLKPDTFVHKKQRNNFYDAVKNGKKDQWYGTLPPKLVEKNADIVNGQIDFPALKKLAQESEQNSFDIAAGIQEATEQYIFAIIEDGLKNIPGKRNLCLSGGVALNSVVVGKIKSKFKEQIDKIFVAPVPYDAGLTLGAAQYVWHHELKNERIKWEDNFTPYLGEKYSKEDVVAALENSSLTYEDCDDNKVLDYLADEKIVSVFGGGSESGRRALGNRSILADPRSPNMKDLINEKVKHRQWFRPFAPSILREEVKNWFVEDIDSPYMSFVIPFKDEVLEKVPAVVHFNKTARLQTVTENDNKWYYNFIKQWQVKSGVPILLNTSFNDREPIVETPTHAINCFSRTEIDYLYFFDYNIICKKPT